MARISHAKAVDLETRRRALGISQRALAERSGVSLPTVKRLLLRGVEHATFEHVRAVSSALGLTIEFHAVYGEREMFDRAVREKAEAIARAVRATSALEAQGVDRAHGRRLTSQIEARLRAGSRRRVWAR